MVGILVDCQKCSEQFRSNFDLALDKHIKREHHGIDNKQAEKLESREMKDEGWNMNDESWKMKDECWKMKD